MSKEKNVKYYEYYNCKTIIKMYVIVIIIIIKIAHMHVRICTYTHKYVQYINIILHTFPFRSIINICTKKKKTRLGEYV